MSEVHGAMGFIAAVLGGRSQEDDIERYIEEWHDAGGLGVELHDHLGMEWREYALWVERPESLPYILESRRRSLALPLVLGQSPDVEAQSLRRWRETTGRW